MSKSNFWYVLCIIFFGILFGCNAANVKSVMPNEVSTTFQGVVTRDVEDSTVVNLIAQDDYNWSIINPIRSNHLVISRVYTGNLPGGALGKVVFDISNIPKDAFIISAKLGLYTLRYKKWYDEYLGDVDLFQDIDNNEDNREFFDVEGKDFKRSWFILDLTKHLSKEVKKGLKVMYLGLYIPLEGLSRGEFKAAYFASKRMGEKVAPQLIVEYTK